MEAETSHTMMRPTHLSVESVSKTLQDVWELSLHSPAVMMGLTANEDEQWWSISFDRGATGVTQREKTPQQNYSHKS